MICTVNETTINIPPFYLSNLQHSYCVGTEVQVRASIAKQISHQDMRTSHRHLKHIYPIGLASQCLLGDGYF